MKEEVAERHLSPLGPEKPDDLPADPVRRPITPSPQEIDYRLLGVTQLHGGEEGGHQRRPVKGHQVMGAHPPAKEPLCRRAHTDHQRQGQEAGQDEPKGPKRAVGPLRYENRSGPDQ